MRRPPTQILLSRYNSKLIIFHRGTSFNQSNLLQAIDVRQIYDKFPESKGGLKDLYDKGPSGAFFLVKFWVSFHLTRDHWCYRKGAQVCFCSGWFKYKCARWRKCRLCSVQCVSDQRKYLACKSKIWTYRTLRHRNFVCFSYESQESFTITCSTKVCSFGKQVVEKLEVSEHKAFESCLTSFTSWRHHFQTEYARYENGRYVYRITRSEMCEYMVNFILKLKHLPEKVMMNSVLENFTILQVTPPKNNHQLPDKAHQLVWFLFSSSLGRNEPRYARNAAVHRVRVRSVNEWTWRPTPYLQTRQRLIDHYPLPPKKLSKLTEKSPN